MKFKTLKSVFLSCLALLIFFYPPQIDALANEWVSVPKSQYGKQLWNKNSIQKNENGNFLLLAKNAILQGSIQYDKPSSKLIEWKQSGSATWNLSNIPHGTYQATLNYHAGPFAGGTISLNIGPSSGTYSITGSGKWKEKKTLKFSEFEITKPNYSFVILALKSRIQGIMELESILLTPVDKDNTDQ